MRAPVSDKLSPDDQPHLTKAFIEHILHEYGLTLLDYSEAKSGIENATLIISTDQGKFALRVYRQNKKSPEHIHTEAELMGYMNENGVPTPKVIRTTKGSLIAKAQDGGRLWYAMLMEFIDGRHLEHYDPSLIQQLAAMQAKMHLKAIEFSSRVKPQTPFDVLQEGIFHKLLAKKQLRNPDVRDFLARAKTYQVPLSESLPRGWSHFDFDPDNILFDGKNRIVSVLDFDDSDYLPLAVCLGYTLWDLYTAEDEPSLLREYLENYQNVRSLSSEEIEYLPRIMLFRHYVVSSMDILKKSEDSLDELEILRQERVISGLQL